MSQSYFPITNQFTSTPLTAAPETLECETITVEEHTHMEAEDAAAAREILHAQNAPQAYLEEKDHILGSLDSTAEVLNELRDVNETSWVVRYPTLQPSTQAAPIETTPEKPGRPSLNRSPHRSLSFADAPSSVMNVVLSPSPSHRGPGMFRSQSLADIGEKEASSEDDLETLCGSPKQKEAELEPTLFVSPNSSEDFQVLRLDLRLDHYGVTSTPIPLVSQLEKNSIAALLNDRVGAALAHVQKLRTRIEDPSSKVLVTGDLNCGKSTLVNALLQRDVMPVDQQPCTTMFCEIHDALAENDGQEEAHVVKEGMTYDIKDETTFTRVAVEDLEEIVTKSDAQHVLKLYVNDTKAANESLLRNGIANISLIDAPGLNTDSLKTTAVFAREEEIDVVVFVVSAENHFTLSACQFLESASREKAYIFVVVNKYDQIKNKERCRTRVLEQIRKLSPRTYEDAEDLVHFVDSASALAQSGALTSDSAPRPSPLAGAFEHLKDSLRDFVLEKRYESKLLPAITYMTKVLSDLVFICSANKLLADYEIVDAETRIAKVQPILEKLNDGKERFEEGLSSEEEETVRQVGEQTRALLETAISRIGEGRLAVEQVDLEGRSQPRNLPSLPPYPGLLNAFDYAANVRKALLRSLDLAVTIAEDETRAATSGGIDRIRQVGDEHLPEDVERPQRIFVPQAMFSQKKGKKRSSIVAGGAYGLGIGLASRPDMLESTFADILDMQYQLFCRFGGGEAEAGSQTEDEDDPKMTVLSMLSVGVSVATMVGGKSIGIRGLAEGTVRIGNLFGDVNTRNWALGVVGLATIGLGAYFVVELPQSIPRNVGRRIQHSLLQASPASTSVALASLTSAGQRTSQSQPIAFIPAHVLRMEQETRKVLRLASWEVKESFRGALDQNAKEMKTSEEALANSRRAKQHFENIVDKAEDIRFGLGVESTTDVTIDA